MTDPYATLGIARTASEAEIRAAYRKLAHEHHPDRWVSAPARLQRKAVHRMTELNLAYRQLMKQLDPDDADDGEPTRLRREEARRRERQRRWEEAELQRHSRASRDRAQELRREEEAGRARALEHELAAQRAREVLERRRRLAESQSRLGIDDVQQSIVDLREELVIEPQRPRRRFFRSKP